MIVKLASIPTYIHSGLVWKLVFSKCTVLVLVGTYFKFILVMYTVTRFSLDPVWSASAILKT